MNKISMALKLFYILKIRSKQGIRVDFKVNMSERKQIAYFTISIGKCSCARSGKIAQITQTSENVSLMMYELVRSGLSFLLLWSVWDIEKCLMRGHICYF